jgi:Fe-S cluster biogenesis protein NfuA
MSDWATQPATADSAAAERALIERVEAAIERVRPALLADGGNCEILDVRAGVVTLKLIGACGSCPMSQMTLRHGLERAIREDVPEIVRVEAV